MQRKVLVAFILMSLSLASFSQVDSVRILDPVVMSAVRIQKSIGDIPIPITIITAMQIKQSGLQKLSDLLQQQSGLMIAPSELGQSLNGYPNPFGSGIQLQGLDAGNTQILIDGMPMVGRNAGVLNLDRIKINNIQQIEIIKGTAASLYGANALAGVINIVTKNDVDGQTTLYATHSSNQTFAGSVQHAKQFTKLYTQLFIDGSNTQGYDLDTAIYGKTVDPNSNISAQLKTQLQISPTLLLNSSFRYNQQLQKNNYLIFTGLDPSIVNGKTYEGDWGIYTEVQKKLPQKAQVRARLYYTGYKNNASVNLKETGELYDKSFLTQSLLKNEYIFEKQVGQQTFLSGIGADIEQISSSRYENTQQLYSTYAFLQHDFWIDSKFNILSGLRLDKSKYFNPQLNPRLAFLYKQSSRLSFLASAGRGFKAPDFRQQFLDFTNNVIGYTLLGANEIYSGLEKLKAQGQIASSIDIEPYKQVPKLLAEDSWGLNAEVNWRITRAQNIKVTGFRNSIKNVIDRFILPFNKVNGQSIYSYNNFNRIYTEGFSLQYKYRPNNNFSLSSSYQFLIANDKDVVAAIKAAKILKRDPVSFETTGVTLKDYGGLFNRSKHSFSILGNYNYSKIGNFNLRAVYVGRAGFSDVNGNGILDDYREYTKGYTLLGFTFSKQIINGLQVQLGANNLLNYTDISNLPFLSGRTYFFATSFEFNTKKNKH